MRMVVTVYLLRGFHVTEHDDMSGSEMEREIAILEEATRQTRKYFLERSRSNLPGTGGESDGTYDNKSRR